MDMPEKILNETELENFLAVPAPGLIEMMKRLDGDIMILGVAGKMGVTMAFQAVEAIKAAGVSKNGLWCSAFFESGRTEQAGSAWSKDDHQV